MGKLAKGGISSHGFAFLRDLDHEEDYVEII